ncbi:outer membrane protein assembly factor BamB [Deinobacterium chartae]|uniref:Outer membrane protein assembly factor BamB n=1 Tax=Deinobacterium chartae TaxID=521158 RepID=A0A841HWK5_9DEIO|nr:PQQ-binding-like beta-propeller repeat protein [Deinobacterium chartae]MBB6097233.1 outer membrane protein assembly factor BamB [Deinobacterium chartae]
MISHRIRLFSLALSPLLAALLLGGPSQAQTAPVASYQGPITQDPAAQVRERQPLWRVTLQPQPEDPLAARSVIGNGRVYYLDGGRLHARGLADGRVRWTYGSGLEGPLTYASGGRVILNVGGQIVALQADSGRVVWKVPLKSRAYHLEARGSDVFATTAEAGLAIDAASGQVRWRLEETELQGIAGVARGVLLWSAYQGEPHFSATYGVDLQSGQKLWRLGRTAGPLAIEGDNAVLLDAGWLGNDDLASTAIVIDLRSGREVGRRSFRADFSCDGMYSRSTGELRFSGATAYVTERCGTRVAQYPAVGGREPQLRFSAPYGAVFRAGPVQGLLLFETRDGSLLGIPTAGRQPVSYNGVSMPTGPGRSLGLYGHPLSRLDVFGKRLYVGTTDGLFYATDLDTRRTRYFVRTRPQGFGPTLKAGPYLLLQTPGELLVVQDLE